MPEFPKWKTGKRCLTLYLCQRLSAWYGNFSLFTSSYSIHSQGCALGVNTWWYTTVFNSSLIKKSPFPREQEEWTAMYFSSLAEHQAQSSCVWKWTMEVMCSSQSPPHRPIVIHISPTLTGGNGGWTSFLLPTALNSEERSFGEG